MVLPDIGSFVLRGPLPALMLVLTVLLNPTAATAQCEAEPGPCQIENGIYHILRPAGIHGAVPAVMFLHGYGSNGENVMKNNGMVNEILSRGYALITPSGRDRQGNDGQQWSFHPDWPEARDESVFLREVLDDAQKNHGIKRDQVLLAGFSLGGSMVSYAACEDPTLARAYAPVAGSFWRPHPISCTGPVKLLHMHGWRDTTVPLEGRYLGGNDGLANRRAQGDVFQAMEIWRETNACNAMRADAFDIEANFWHRRWERCDDDSALEFVLFPGGHAVPPGWADMAIDWFEAL